MEENGTKTLNNRSGGGSLQDSRDMPHGVILTGANVGSIPGAGQQAAVTECLRARVEVARGRSDRGR